MKTKGLEMQESKMMDVVRIVRCGYSRAASIVHEKRGQGTVEYAILVGVLVVIAIGAIVLLGGKLNDLWTTISDAFGKL